MELNFDKWQTLEQKKQVINQLFLDKNILDFTAKEATFCIQVLSEVERKNKDRKKILVMFSGGLDSTYLCWKALKEGHSVKAVYVKLHNNENQNQLQLECSKRLERLFYEEFPGKFELNDFSEFLIQNRGSFFLPQIPLWIFMSLYNTSDYKSDIDEIHIGYVCNDDALRFIPDIKNLYESFRPLVENQKLPELFFPLSKTHKHEIIEYLPSEYKKWITFCENPSLDIQDESKIYTICGECPSCKKIKSYSILNYFRQSVIIEQTEKEKFQQKMLNDRKLKRRELSLEDFPKDLIVDDVEQIIDEKFKTIDKAVVTKIGGDFDTHVNKGDVWQPAEESLVTDNENIEIMDDEITIGTFDRESSAETLDIHIPEVECIDNTENTIITYKTN